MCIQALTLENGEASFLTIAFHADITNCEQAERKLFGKPAGSFLTFSVNGSNFCSAVDASGSVRHNPFRWDVSGCWYNGSPKAYATEAELLNHLVDGCNPCPVCK